MVKGLIMEEKKKPTKEEIQKHLRQFVMATHERHKGKTGKYKISVVMENGLEQIGKKQLEKMGCTVMDPIDLSDKGKS